MEELCLPLELKVRAEMNVGETPLAKQSLQNKMNLVVLILPRSFIISFRSLIGLLEYICRKYVNSLLVLQKFTTSRTLLHL